MTKDDRPRCIAWVYAPRMVRSTQCQRRATVDGKWCRQHSPSTTAAREKERRARGDQKWAEERYRFHGKSFFRVLQEIAAGHNDPRALAKQTINDFEKGAPKPG